MKNVPGAFLKRLPGTFFIIKDLEALPQTPVKGLFEKKFLKNLQKTLVSSKTGNNIDQKAGKRPVTGMLNLTDIFWKSFTDSIIERFLSKS